MKVFVDGQEVDLDPAAAQVATLNDRLVVKTSDGTRTAVAVRAGDAVLVSYLGRQFRIEAKRPRAAWLGAAANGEMRAPMPGLIVDVLKKAGDRVSLGDKILVLEAMKTQQAFTAPFEGTLLQVNVSKGDQVIEGALLALVKPVEADERTP